MVVHGAANILENYWDITILTNHCFWRKNLQIDLFEVSDRAKLPIAGF